MGDIESKNQVFEDSIGVQAEEQVEQAGIEALVQKVKAAEEAEQRALEEAERCQRRLGEVKLRRAATLKQRKPAGP